MRGVAMGYDDDLFDWLHARGGDPPTSHEAVPKDITAQARKILRIYLYAGRPLLDVEAYRLAGFGPTACDGKRCSDLRQRKFIERTGERGVTPSGKSAYLCQITETGVKYLNERKLMKGE